MADSYTILRNFLNEAIGGTDTDAVLYALSTGDDLLAQNSEAAVQNMFLATAAGEFLDYLAANVGVVRPNNIGISDDSLRNISKVFIGYKNTTNSINDLLKIYFSIYQTNAYAETQNGEDFELSDGDNLIIKVDDSNEYDIVFDTAYFNNIATASATEVANYLNNYFLDLQINAVATTFLDLINNITTLRIITKTSGSRGSIEILGGTAQKALSFSSLIDTAQTDTTEFTVSESDNGIFRYAWTGGTDPDFDLINPGDYVVVSGNFETVNQGSFTITQVVSGNEDNSYFEVYNTSGTNESLTLSHASDVMFFNNVKNKITSRDQYAAIFETTPGAIDLTIPASTAIVERTPSTGGSYLLETTYTFDVTGLNIWEDVTVFSSGPNDVADLNCMATDGAGKVIAVSNPGGISYSLDGGVSWHVDSITNTHFTCAAYGNGTWIACDSVGNIWYNTGDLVSANWTWAFTVAGGYKLNYANYVGGKFIVVGQSGTAVYSSDGISWTAGVTSVLKDIYKYTYNGSRVIAVASNNTILLSDNLGATWAGSASGMPGNVLDIAWSAPLNMFVCVGDGVNGVGYTTDNGINFIHGTLPVGMTLNNLSVIAWFNDRFVIGDDNGNIATSLDGINWTQELTVTLTGSQALSIAYSNSLLVIAGVAGTYATFDGTTWAPYLGTLCFGEKIFNLIYTGSAFVAIGDNEGDASKGSILDLVVGLEVGETIIDTDTYASGTVLSITGSTLIIGDVQNVVSEDFGGSGSLYGETSGITANYSATPTKTSDASLTGTYLYDPDSYVITSTATNLTETISLGTNNIILNVVSTEGFDSSGFLVIDFGLDNEETLVPYVAILNSTEIQIDPSYTFRYHHTAGADITLLNGNNKYTVSNNGDDLGVYLTDVANARQNFIDNLNKIKSAGIVLNQNILYPTDYGLPNADTIYSGIIRVYGPDSALDTAGFLELI